MSSIAVYCASSPNLAEKYRTAARQTGVALARAGFDVVCGGGRAGLMAEVIDGAVEAGGHAIGVIPRFMIENGWNHPRLTQTIVTDSMHSRKLTMASSVSGVIALPGGCGTLDELFEIITWRQLGIFHGNIAILNLDGYYDPLKQMLDRMIEEHFMNPDHAALWHFATTVDDAVAAACANGGDIAFSQKLD